MTAASSVLRHARVSALLLAGSLLLADAASAQTLAEQTASQPARPVTTPSRFVSTNPFLPLAGYFSAEYEQRVRDNVAFAIAGSHVKWDDRYTNIDAKLRLYPNDTALEGLGIAASLGIGWIKRDSDFLDCAFDPCRNRDGKTFATPSFAVELGYQWLLGRSRSTALTAGFGAKRYLGGSQAQFDGIERVVPTARLSIGYGF